MISDYQRSYKNQFLYEQEKKKEANKRNNGNKTTEKSKNSKYGTGNNKSPIGNSMNIKKIYDKNSTDDYKRLTKKFYYIIVNLQEELIKETSKNLELKMTNDKLRKNLEKVQKK